MSADFVLRHEGNHRLEEALGGYDLDVGCRCPGGGCRGETVLGVVRADEMAQEGGFPGPRRPRKQDARVAVVLVRQRNPCLTQRGSVDLPGLNAVVECRNDDFGVRECCLSP